jgi:putative transposase
MARHPRLVLPGVALHVIQRGNNRNACFGGHSDYLAYLAHLRHLCGKYGCELHAYCLMTNHVHLLMTPDDDKACSLLMQDLGRSYVRYFNRRHERSGTLWEGRFRSCIVESAEYVLACYRYIELNPVRARMVEGPSDYPWSSHAVNTGVGTDPLVRPHTEFAALAGDDKNAYQALFAQPFGDDLLKSIRDATNGGYPLASDAFKARLVPPSGCRMARGRPGPRVTVPVGIITTLTPN